MAKRLIYVFLFVFLASIQAQASIGEWKKFGVFGNNITNIIDTDSKVYYLSDGWLFYYDKENDETVSLSENGDLNDVAISNIYYSHDKGILFVAYNNSNIDLVYDNGNIFNLPDIYNANITSSKTINDVSFAENGIYVATDFGYVLINDEKREVKESRIYNTKIRSLCVAGKHLILSDNSQLYIEEIGKHYNNLGEVHKTTLNQSGFLTAVDDTKFLLNTGWLFIINVENNTLYGTKTLSSTGVKNLQRTKTGFQFTDNNGVLFRMDENCENKTYITLPSSMKNSRISSYESDGSIWEFNTDGLRHLSLSEDGTETVLMDFYRPNASSVDVPYYLVYNTPLQKLYVMNCGANRYFNSYTRIGAMSSYDGTSWKNEMPDYAPTINSNQDNKKVNGTYSLTFDPEDPNTLYIGTWFEGVYKITDGKIVAKYDWTNSPIEKIVVSGTFTTCTAPNIQFDKNNNLWITQSGNSNNQFAVLPRAKQSKENLTKEDWLTPIVNGVSVNYTGSFLITSKDIKLYSNGIHAEPLVLFYDNSNPQSSNIESKVYTSLTDQDGKQFTWNYINCFAEDQRGKVWMGTSHGVVELTPQNAFNGNNFTINHIKVPRNDGTNLADYLLDNTDVTCIEVDGSDRKWIGTSTSGVLLVSEDGSEIINQFTTDNSPLLSNKVISVKCNPLNNKVYIGTDKGLMEYSSDSEPAAESFSNIYAYPNPVRPEYTGLITIRGLMENSLVKIADSEGNVVRNLQSTGGLTTWDGCDYTGKPVKSGVYFVLASQNENEMSSGATTKILIIR